MLFGLSLSGRSAPGELVGLVVDLGLDLRLDLDLGLKEVRVTDPIGDWIDRARRRERDAEKPDPSCTLRTRQSAGLCGKTGAALFELGFSSTPR